MQRNIWSAAAMLPQTRKQGLRTPRVLCVLLLLGMLLAQAVYAEGPCPAGECGEIPPGYIRVEGDILVKEDEYRQYGLRSGYMVNLWPNGIVPYYFHQDVDAQKQQIMRQAMNDWEAVSNVRFVPIPGSEGRDYWVRIQLSPRNDSMVGRQSGGQLIGIHDWEEFIIVHELGHCLGLIHEHTRPDRDSYVFVNSDYIQDDEGHNFDRHNDAGFVGPYDFNSIMHYGACDFSIDCSAGQTCNCTRPPITVLPPYQDYWQSRIGQRDHLSFWDKVGMSFYYAPADWRWINSGYDGQVSDGMLFTPYVTLPQAADLMPSGGTLWFWPRGETYHGAGDYSKPMTWRVIADVVTIGP